MFTLESNYHLPPLLARGGITRIQKGFLSKTRVVLTEHLQAAAGSAVLQL